MRAARLALLLGFAGVAGAIGRAHEVDQYTVPVGCDYAELGPVFTRVVYVYLDAATRHVNDEIALAERLGWADRVRHLQSPDAIARAVNAQFPTFVTYIEDLEFVVQSPQWRQRFPGLIVGYRPVQCIYDNAHAPLDVRKVYLLWRSSTVMVNGVYLGTDKFGHFVHNGLNYFAEYRRVLAASGSRESAMRAAVSLGTGSHLYFSETQLLGALTSGVISNADLAANYLGLKFYLNLTEPVMLLGREQPAMLQLVNGRWQLAQHVQPDSDFLVRFFSDHWDEVLNPNVYEPYMADHVRMQMQRRCAAVRGWYADVNGMPRPAGWFTKRLNELKTYFGEDYGYIGDPAARLTIDNACNADGGLGGAVGGVSALHAAVAEPQKLRGLVDAGAALEARDELGRTPLCWAVRAGQGDAVAFLLMRGANANAADNDGETPLHHAARLGYTKVARLLFENGADVNARARYGTTPLHLAVRWRHAPLAGLFVGYGAVVNDIDDFGRSAVNDAAAYDDSALLRALQTGGARTTSTAPGSQWP